MRDAPSVSDLRRELDYCAETGMLAWKVRRKGVVPGRQVSAVSAAGYVVVGFGKRIFLAHRVAWAIHYGSWPEKQIDHINRVRSDTRLANLRQADGSENNANRSLCDRNASGVKGVSWDAARRKWKAQLVARKRRVLSARFDCKELAELVYQEALSRHFGAFAPLSIGAPT